MVQKVMSDFEIENAAWKKELEDKLGDEYAVDYTSLIQSFKNPDEAVLWEEHYFAKVYRLKRIVLKEEK